jgi:hypothetical protein
MSTSEKIVSRHATSAGIVVWRRCHCGRLRMTLVPYDDDGRRLTAGGRCPDCG